MRCPPAALQHQGLGASILDMSDALVSFIFAIWDAFWVSVGLTVSPILNFSPVPSYSAYTPFSNNAGLDMYKSSKGSSVPRTGHQQESNLIFTSKIFAKETWRWWTWTFRYGKMPPMIAYAGDVIYTHHWLNISLCCIMCHQLILTWTIEMFKN